MNKYVKLLGANVILFGGLALASCGGGNASVNVPTVTNFVFNSETGEFSFTGVEGAKHYYIRVYNQHEYKTVDGKEVELSLEEKGFVAARRVRAKVDETEYSGEVSLEDLAGGKDYDVYAFTYMRDGNGDLVSSHTEAKSFIVKGTYRTPELEYQGKKLVAGETNSNGKLQITLRSNFFGFDSNYDQGNPNYEFKIYDMGDTLKETKVLKFADVETEAVEGTSKSGEKTITYNHKGVVTFDNEYDLSAYKLSIQVLSTDDSHWASSGVSEKGVLADVLGDPNAEESGGNNDSSKGGTKDDSGNQGGDPGQQSGEPAASGEGSKAEGSGETSGDGSKAEGSGEPGSGDGSKAEGSGEAA